MNFTTSLDYLYGLQRFGIKLGLDNTQAIMSRLPLLQRPLPSVHVAGTNGKGSVSVMLAEILRHSGLRVGLYTSPHMHCFTERIRIDGNPISQDEVAQLTLQVRGAAEGVPVTFFEATTAMALLAFQTHRVDVAVIETPRRGASSRHGYLVTCWTRVRPESFGPGVYSQDPADDLLCRLGQDRNVVYLLGVVPGTAAYEAGLRRDDIVLAVDGERITSDAVFSEKIRRNFGRETVISVSRLGELLEIPVNIDVPTVRSNMTCHVRPWERTAPTDWSSLSAANVTASVLAYQQQQRELEAACERGR